MTISPANDNHSSYLEKLKAVLAKADAERAAEFEQMDDDGKWQIFDSGIDRNACPRLQNAINSWLFSSRR